MPRTHRDIPRPRTGRANGHRALAALAATALAGAVSVVLAPAASAAPATYYVDCQAGGSSQTGSEAQPFTSLAKASSHVFLPGESLLLKRGTVCTGALDLQGSGTSAAWNSVGAYGAGDALPTIDGGTDTTHPSAVTLKNVSYWQLSDLDISGGYWRGLWIMADAPGVTQHGFRLTGLKVHDQGNRPRIDKADGKVRSDWISSTGSVIVEPCAATAKLDGVDITRVDAYQGHEVGFQIGHAEKPAVYDPGVPGGYNTPDCHMGLPSGELPSKDGVSNVNITDSGAAYNDESGIWGSGVTNLTITGSRLHDNGNGLSADGSTPSLLNGEGAWWSNSYGVTATDNDSYANRRGGGDGGGFDADTYTEKSVISGNRISGNDAYCVAVFGGRGLPTSNVEIDHNKCTDNGVNASARYQGDIFTWTSNRPGDSEPNPQSTIDNINVHDNVIKRGAPGPWLTSQSDYLPGTTTFWNNDVTHEDGALLVDIETCRTEWKCDATQPRLNLNTYRVSGPGPVGFAVAPYQLPDQPVPDPGSPADPYTSFAAYQEATGQDPASTFTQP